MKFNVSSSKLFAQLQAVSRVIAAKNSLQILEAVLFDLEGDVLTLTASDSETTIRTSLTVEDAQGAGKDDEIATLLVQVIDRLKGVFINDIKRACSVWRTRIVAQVEIVVLGEMLANVIQDCQSAVTAVENTNQISLKFIVYS